MMTVLERYILANDLDADTERTYRSVFRVLQRWHGSDIATEIVTAELLSRFLQEKQKAGKSSHYCKTLRSVLLTVLGRLVDRRDVRRIRAERLSPHSWTPLEVQRLILSVCCLPSYKQAYYRQVIAVAYHTGLSKKDLHRITRGDFAVDGTLLFERHKTGADIVVWLPPVILERLPTEGALIPRRWSDEQFRKDFRKIVQRAGLTGTFKTLRKTSGTQADLINGRGHEHLANTRRVFDIHYKDRKIIHREPTRLPPIELPDDDAA